MDAAEISHRFAFHPANTEEKRAGHGSIRAACAQLAVQIHERLPECREKSLAITKIEEAMFWANAGLARESAKQE